MARFDVPSATPSPTSSEGSDSGSKTPSRASPQLPRKSGKGIQRRKTPNLFDHNADLPGAYPNSSPKKSSPRSSGRVTKPSSPQGQGEKRRSGRSPRTPQLPSSEPNVPAGRQRSRIAAAVHAPDPETPHEEPITWWKRETVNGKLQWRICRVVVDQRQTIDADAADDVRTVLSHPNLITMLAHEGFEAGQEDGLKGTTWEYCRGGSLEDFITASDGQAIAEPLIWHTMISLLKAVSYLESGAIQSTGESQPVKGWKTIVHHQINPRNIFYTHPLPDSDSAASEYGLCKLGNFTRATVLSEPYECLNLLDLYAKDIEGETTGFEAPDLSSFKAEWDVLGNKTVGVASDVWSIGAVAVAMMTGKPIWHLVMQENIKVGMMSRRNEDWRWVNPSERFERLTAMTNKDDKATKLWQALPLTYSKDLKRLVQEIVTMKPSLRFVVEDVLNEVRRRRANVVDQSS